MHRAGVVGSCIALLVKSVLAAPGDGLVVIGDFVNVRAGPSMEYRVSLVRVELAGRGEEGWIHQSLLEVISRAQPAAAPATPAASAAGPEAARSPGQPALSSAQQPGSSALPSVDGAGPQALSEREALARFRANVDDLNARAQALVGVDLFTGAEPAGGGTVQVLVTDAWDLVPEAGQESYANALLDHWRLAAGLREPLRLQVIDPSGTVVVEKSSPASP